MKKFLFSTLIIMIISTTLSAQKGVSTFLKKSLIYQPYASETRSTLNKIELGYLNDMGDMYYLDNENQRAFLLFQFGWELPLFSYEKKNTRKHTRQVLHLSLPASVSGLVDFFENTTAPLINCDYWFGLQTTGIYYTPFFQHIGIHNIAFKIVPLLHESTHLGDEVSLHGYQTIDDFKRINISYEAWEIGFTVNDPDTITSSLLSFKTGIMGLWSPSQGYYKIDSLEVKGADVPTSTNNFDYYFSLNWQRSKGFACSEQWVNIVSAEIRNRLQFNYSSVTDQNNRWCINATLGWTKRETNTFLNSIGFFARYYYGVNPYGQFRDAYKFRYAGFSIIVGG